MIRIRTRSFGLFIQVFGILVAYGVQVTPVGANELLVPNTTDIAILRLVAEMGAQVDVDLSEDDPDPEPQLLTLDEVEVGADVAGDDQDLVPIQSPKKTRARRVTTPKVEE